MKYEVVKIADLAVEEMKKVVMDAGENCLHQDEDGNFYAVSDIFTHEEYSRSDGELWGFDVECPAYGSPFNLQTGAVTGLPAVIPAKTYPVIVEGDDVYVEI